MTGANLNNVLDDFSHLPMEDKEYAFEVIQKQLMKAKRDAIADRAGQAKTSLKKGMVKKGGLKDLREDLENDEHLH